MLAPPAVIALLVIFSRNHNVSRFSCNAIIWNTSRVAVYCRTAAKHKRAKKMGGGDPGG
jgi:hypothetical protein